MLKMKQVKLSIEDLADLYDFYFSKNYFDKDFKNVLNPLIESFNENYGFPLSFDDGEADYYPSVIATILMALYHTRMINVDFKNKIYNSIFNLKDKTPNKITKEKRTEDSVAWDVSESANCWTTSVVIDSLLETGYYGDEIEKIKEAVLWLKDQQRDDGGWGFDKTCISRVFFTARVLHALQLGKELFASDSSEKSDVKTTISLGIGFIEKEAKNDLNIVYWTVAKDNGEADPTNTVMALWILNKLNKLNEEVKKKALNYLRNELRNKEIWDFKTIVNETNTKYSSHKIIISFTPSIPLVLFELGVDPMDELCLKPILWLKNNLDNGWKLPEYQAGILSFAYALGLWTVIKWHREATREILIGSVKTNIFIRLRKRITVALAVTLILFLVAIRNYIFGSMFFVYNAFYEFYITYGLISAVVSIITLIVAIFSFPKSVVYIDQRFFNYKFRNTIKNTFKKLYAWIYVK